MFFLYLCVDLLWPLDTYPMGNACNPMTQTTLYILTHIILLDIAMSRSIKQCIYFILDCSI